MLTRRHFLYGVAGVAALAAVGGGAAWAAGRSGDDDALKTLKVPENAVTAQTDLEEMENYEDAVTLAGSAKLPFGTLVWCSDDAVAACLLPTETAKPLAEVGLLDLSSAECTTIIEHAVGEAEGFEIYDVRANSAGVVWTEADILDNVWRVYAASLSGTTLGEPQLLDEGDVNWEMPTLAVAAGYAFWQRLPQLDGNARVEDSQLLRAAFGTADSQVVYASQGRMACAPTSCGDSLAPRPHKRHLLPAHPPGRRHRRGYRRLRSALVHEADGMRLGQNRLQLRFRRHLQLRRGYREFGHLLAHGIPRGRLARGSQR